MSYIVAASPMNGEWSNIYYKWLGQGVKATKVCCVKNMHTCEMFIFFLFAKGLKYPKPK